MNALINPRPFEAALHAIRAHEESDGWRRDAVQKSAVQFTIPSRFKGKHGHFTYPFTCEWNQGTDTLAVSSRLPDDFLFQGVHKNILDSLVDDVNAYLKRPELVVDALVEREFRVFPGMGDNTHLVTYGMIAKSSSFCRPALIGELLEQAKTDFETTLCLFGLVYREKRISRECIEFAFMPPGGRA